MNVGPVTLRGYEFVYDVRRPCTCQPPPVDYGLIHDYTCPVTQDAIVEFVTSQAAP